MPNAAKPTCHTETQRKQRRRVIGDLFGDFDDDDYKGDDDGDDDGSAGYVSSEGDYITNCAHVSESERDPLF